MLESFSLSGRSALVTGAGRGIGRALAQGLAEAGANVSCVDIDPETAARAAAEIRVAGVDTVAITADVTKEEQITTMLEEHTGVFDGIDILVNNAGICVHAHAEAMAAADWDLTMDLNLKGLFLVSQAVGRVMIARGAGSIINVASMSGSIVNVPQAQAAYNASKAGVIMLTKSLAGEWAPHGIRVNSISPGYTKTEMAMMPEAIPFHGQWTSLVPMGRMCEPRELAPAVVFLASDAASYITGHDLVIDGGYTVW